MTTSDPSAGGVAHDQPWARASLRISGHLVDPETFEDIIRRLGVTSGKITLNTTGDRRIWIDDCPLDAESRIEEQLSWALQEADAVVGQAQGSLAGCTIELWLGLAVRAQLGVVCDASALRRLGDLSIDLVLDLYGWD
jgi:hypothetical protein